MKPLSFRLLGFPVEVQPAAWLLLGFLLLLYARAGPEGLLRGGILGAVILGSVLVHELGHALASRASGLSSRIVLHGLGGFTLHGRPRRPLHGLLISLAGPAAGFLLGATSLALLLLRPPGGPGELLLRDLVLVNLFWSAFNLLPMLPLDGSHAVLHLLLLLGVDPYGAETAVSRLSLVVSVGVLAAAIYWRQWIVVLFAFFALRRSLRGLPGWPRP